MSTDPTRYTLEEARRVIADEMFAKICGGLGHDLHILRSDARGKPPMAVSCRYCLLTWDVEPCMRQAKQHGGATR